MRILLLLVLICFCGNSLNAQALKAKEIKSIEAIMDKQENCWNEGDLNCFMEGYWQSASLRFMGKSGVTYGWQSTLDRYIKSYPDKATMGQLTFNIISLEKLSRKKALMVGQWQLKRDNDDVGGHFSLIWKKIKGEWLIVFDHSS